MLGQHFIKACLIFFGMTILQVSSMIISKPQIDAEMTGPESFLQNAGLGNLGRRIQYRGRPHGHGVHTGTRGGCSRYVIISARGTGESQVHPISYTSWINSVMRQVPGGRNYETVYVAGTDYIGGPIEGAADITRYLRQQKAQCPGQKYLFLGYSEGAIAIVRALNILPISDEQVAGTVLFGSPVWQPGKSYDRGSATRGQGSASIQHIEIPPRFANKMFDGCINGDVVCTSSGSLVQHVSYQRDSVFADGIVWAVEKLREIVR